MNKINLITPPDILPNDCYQLLVIYPSRELKQELQETFLAKTEKGTNVYYYDKHSYSASDVSWLLNVFKLCDTAIIDVDNVAPYARDLLSYMIAKPKTFWLTTIQNPLYNHISTNRIYNLNFLTDRGEHNVVKT